VETTPVDDVVSCEHAERCGGCPLIGLSYGAQLAEKRRTIAAAFALYPALAPLPIEPVAVAEPVVGYRIRAKLMVAPPARVGLYAKGGGHDVVDVPHCRVLSPALARIADHLRARIARSEREGGPLAPFDPDGERGVLRAVDLREVSNAGGIRALVTFVVDRTHARDLRALREEAVALLGALPEIAGVAANFHEGHNPQVLGRETVLLAGAARADDRIGPSVHHATFGSFVQVHRAQAARIHTRLLEAFGLEGPAPAPLRLLDLYGGSGAISLGLAAAGARVRMVEAFEPSVEQANSAAREQNLDVEAECADAGAALRALGEAGEHFDGAVLNPPRRGTDPLVREMLARVAPDVVAYVSCDPRTLARDLDHFARLGYRPDRLEPFDMIPLTEEVETVAILRRADIPAPHVLYEDGEVVIVEKAPHEPTTPQGEYAASLLDRVQRLEGAGAAVPVHRLDVGTSGVVLFARGREHVERWAKALSAESARKVYFALVRGIAPGKGAVARALRSEGKLVRARTRYKRVAVVSGQSLVRVSPEQGRTHQIRRHLASIGHPVIGDERYGHAPTNRHFAEKYGLDRTFLHCSRIELDHPETGVRVVVEARMPGDLRAVLQWAGASAGPGADAGADAGAGPDAGADAGAGAGAGESAPD
jgi:23S rRNA (uracil1939-C5)-methyltransferase